MIMDSRTDIEEWFLDAFYKLKNEDSVDQSLLNDTSILSKL